MFYLKESSLKTNQPIFQKLDSTGLLFPERTVAYDFANTGVYERSLINWALTMMDPSKNFVDIGAHVGTWTLTFAKHCKHVYSFECTPRTYNFLCGNIALHNLDNNITVHKTAIGDYDGITNIHVRNEDGGGNTCLIMKENPGIPYETPIHKLDFFNLDNIGMIKIDVEGLEEQVFRGMTETIKRNNYPRIFFESWADYREREKVPSIEIRKKLFDYISSLGYNIVPIRGFEEMFIAER